MTEFEHRELLQMITSNITELTALFISVFVAYLVCAYVAGRNLNRFQVSVITLTYSVFALFLIFLTYGTLMSALNTVASLRETSGPDNPGIYWVGPGSMLVAWIISVVFMYQARKPSMEKPRDEDT